jgi:hypothetical protein
MAHMHLVQPQETEWTRPAPQSANTAEAGQPAASKSLGGSWGFSSHLAGFQASQLLKMVSFQASLDLKLQ